MDSISNLLNQTSNKKILVILPHPDDETVMTSILIQEALSLGFEVKVICVTNGLLGRIHIHGQGRSLVQIRKEELTNAMKLLGVDDFVMWRFCDGLLKELENWKSEVKDLIETFDPGLVVSYGPDGVSGHPDHLALGRYVWQLWLEDQNFNLLWPSFVGTTLKYLKNKTQTADRIVAPNWKTDPNTDFLATKKLALQAHLSQDLSSPLKWLKTEPDEYFAKPEKNKEYDFSYVDFDLGL